MVDQLLPEWLSREAIAAAIALSALVETPVVVTIGHYNISFSHLEDFYQYELNDEPPPPYVSLATNDPAAGTPASPTHQEIQADQPATLSVEESDTPDETEIPEGDSFREEPSPIEATTPTPPQQVIEVPDHWAWTVMTRDTVALYNDLIYAEPVRVPHFRPPPGTPEEQTEDLLTQWDSETRRSSLSCHRKFRLAYCLGKLQHDHPQAFEQSLQDHYRTSQSGRRATTMGRRDVRLFSRIYPLVEALGWPRIYGSRLTLQTLRQLRNDQFEALVATL